VKSRLRRGLAVVVVALLAYFLADGLGVRRLSGKDFPVATPLGRELAAHVAELSSPKWGGRVPGTKGNDEAAGYLERALQRLGYRPLPQLGSFRSPVGARLGDNVVGFLPGDGSTDAAILLGAHFDHLGVVEPGKAALLGADDNASSVAVVLGALPALAEGPRKHPVVVAFFNTEEAPYFGTSRQGSRRLVSLLKLRPGDVHLAVILDLVGGVVWKKTADVVFACGAEKAPGLGEVVDGVAVRGLEVKRLGIHLVENIPGRAPSAFSDYDVFRDQRMPFLFLSSGRTPRYHHPSDLPDTLYYDRMGLTSAWIAELLRRVDGARPFTFDAGGEDLRSDAATLRPLIDAASRPWSWIPGTGPITAFRLVGDQARVRAIAEKRGAFAPEDALTLERASFRMQCLLYGFPVCFTL
jgi:hypothetical protein